MFGKANNYVIQANTPVKHSEVCPDVLNTVKGNASDKVSDYLTETIISHVAGELGFQNHWVCLQVLPSLLSPVPSFALAPPFPQPKHPSHLYLIFLGSKTSQKHLLCWLVVSRLFQTLISTSRILPSVVPRSKQN